MYVKTKEQYYKLLDARYSSLRLFTGPSITNIRMMVDSAKHKIKFCVIATSNFLIREFLLETQFVVGLCTKSHLSKLDLLGQGSKYDFGSHYS